MTISKNVLIGTIAGVVSIVLVGLALMFAWDRHDAINAYKVDGQTRTAVVDVANKQAAAMLGYTYTSAATELPKAEDGLTPDFRKAFDGLIKGDQPDTGIIAGAVQKQLTVQVEIRGAAVVSASSDKAKVLIFLNQTTTGKDIGQAVVTGSRITMDLEKDNGRWLVSALSPI